MQAMIITTSSSSRQLLPERSLSLLLTFTMLALLNPLVTCMCPSLRAPK
jgi:hypothetical protein